MLERTDNRFFAAVAIAVAVILFVSNRRDGLWYRHGTEPEIMSVASDDAEMNQAMAKARESVPAFLQALESPSSSRSHFSIKVGFHDDNGTEFMWLDDVDHSDGAFLGTVANSPETVTSVRFGDQVTIPAQRIADWMFISDGKLVGGYTLRVMRSRLSPEERKDFDESITFKIE